MSGAAARAIELAINLRRSCSIGGIPFFGLTISQSGQGQARSTLLPHAKKSRIALPGPGRVAGDSAGTFRTLAGSELRSAYPDFSSSAGLRSGRAHHSARGSGPLSPSAGGGVPAAESFRPRRELGGPQTGLCRGRVGGEHAAFRPNPFGDAEAGRTPPH